MGVETAVPKGGLLRGAPLLPLHKYPEPTKSKPITKNGWTSEDG
jgi:hypothetical protein